MRCGAGVLYHQYPATLTSQASWLKSIGEQATPLALKRSRVASEHSFITQPFKRGHLGLGPPLPRANLPWAGARLLWDLPQLGISMCLSGHDSRPV